MRTKLTLRLEDQLIDQAKTDQISTPAPITSSLRGLLRNATLDEVDYKNYLEEKYR